MSSVKNEERFELSLLENALDYVLSAASDAKHDDARQWKYAVLHLFAGIELLLKERLRREHWSLLYAEVNKAAHDSFRAGDFKSVDFDVCCERLGKICGVEIDRQQRLVLESLRRQRNRIQHFDVHLVETEVKTRLAECLNFVVDFCRDRLAPLSARAQRLFDDVTDELTLFNEFVVARRAAIEPLLRGSATYVRCPACHESTIEVDQNRDVLECLLCGYQTTVQDLVCDKGRAEICPRCERGACFTDGRVGHWVCISCGEKAEYERCIECQRLFITESGDERYCEWCNQSLQDYSDG